MSDSFDLASEFEGMTPQEAGFDLLPEEEYTWKVVSSEARKANSGNWQIHTRVEVIEGRFEGESEWLDLTYTKSSVKFFNQQAACLGVDLPTVQRLRTMDKIAAHVRGAIFKGKAIHDDYNGQKRVKVRPTRFIANPEQGGRPEAITGTLDPFKGQDELPPPDDDAPPVGNPAGAADLTAYAPEDRPREAKAQEKELVEVPAAPAPTVDEENPWS